MPPILRRFRRPKAELGVGLSELTPPEDNSGGVVRVQVILSPGESFLVRRGRLELSLLTTLFSPTALDGYHENTSSKLYQTVTLCQNVDARAGEALVHSAELRLPEAPPPDSRPARREWQAKARFDIDGYRELWAGRVLRDVSPRQGGAPVVDGAGFLPPL